MIDKRFSSGAFASRGLDSEAARELADQLADEIANEMHEVVKHHFLKIVGRLNTLGHTLKLDVSKPGEITFRDDREDESGYHCKLRLAYDSIVSSGYAHLTDNIGLNEGLQHRT